MGWTYIGYCKAQDINSGGSINGDTTLNIQAGDLLVGICQGFGSTMTSATISDGGSNSLTMMYNSAYSSVYTHYAYKLSAVANSSATMTFNPGGSSVGYRTFYVLQFRPTSGATVTLETSDIDANGNSTTPTSDNVNIPAGDCIAIGGYGKFGSGSERSISTPLIAGLSADGAPYTATYYAHMWYRNFSSEQNNANASCTISGTSSQWVRAGILVFKATTTATGNPFYYYRNQ